MALKLCCSKHKVGPQPSDENNVFNLSLVSIAAAVFPIEIFPQNFKCGLCGGARRVASKSYSICEAWTFHYNPVSWWLVHQNEQPTARSPELVKELEHTILTPSNQETPCCVITSTSFLAFSLVFFQSYRPLRALKKLFRKQFWTFTYSKWNSTLTKFDINFRKDNCNKTTLTIESWGQHRSIPPRDLQPIQDPVQGGWKQCKYLTTLPAMVHTQRQFTWNKVMLCSKTQICWKLDLHSPVCPSSTGMELLEPASTCPSGWRWPQHPAQTVTVKRVKSQESHSS